MRASKTRKELESCGFNNLRCGLMGKLKGDEAMLYMPIDEEKTKYRFVYHGKKDYVLEKFGGRRNE